MDRYIDDTVAACKVLDNGKEILAQKNTALLISKHIVPLPLSKNEPIHRDDPQLLNNMDAEAQPREEIIYLD